MLSAWSSGSNRFSDEIFRWEIDFDLAKVTARLAHDELNLVSHIFRLGKNSDRHRTRVNATTFLRLGNALHPMHTTFILQTSEDISTVDERLALTKTPWERDRWMGMESSSSVPISV